MLPIFLIKKCHDKLRFPILSHGISNFLFSIEFIDNDLNVQEALSLWFLMAFNLVTLSGFNFVSNDVRGDGIMLFEQNVYSAVAWCAKKILLVVLWRHAEVIKGQWLYLLVWIFGVFPILPSLSANKHIYKPLVKVYGSFDICGYRPWAYCL